MDAIQYLLSCTVGKGNLLIKPYGKSAYTFYNRKTGEGVRLLMMTIDREADRDETMRRILTAPADEIMTSMEPTIPMPEKARIFTSIRCDQCGEHCREDKIRLKDGGFLCLSCFNPYDRG